MNRSASSVTRPKPHASHTELVLWLLKMISSLRTAKRPGLNSRLMNMVIASSTTTRNSLCLVTISTSLRNWLSYLKNQVSIHKYPDLNCALNLRQILAVSQQQKSRKNLLVAKTSYARSKFSLVMTTNTVSSSHTKTHRQRL